jgi:coenzyme F420-reducing hydrogenase beta subunit
MNIFSDITVGDPWGIDEKTELAGNTVVIARTQKGKELIENAYRDGAIRVEKLPVDNIILGQTVDNRLKTQFFTSTNLTIKNGNPVPFNLDNFHNIKYEKPTESKKKLITSRLKYSREIYKEKDTIKYTTMVNAATSLVKKSWKRQNRMIFLIRCFRYALRKLKIKK